MNKQRLSIKDKMWQSRVWKQRERGDNVGIDHFGREESFMGLFNKKVELKFLKISIHFNVVSFRVRYQSMDFDVLTVKHCPNLVVASKTPTSQWIICQC